MTPDVNVLVAASRRDHPHHATALAWLEEALADAGRGAAFAVFPVVTAGFLRIVTHPRVFPRPTPMPAALDFVDALLAAPGVETCPLGAEWPRIRRLCEAHALSGNDVTDAWIAAAVVEHHEHLVTFDRGFARLLDRRDLTILPA